MPGQSGMEVHQFLNGTVQLRPRLPRHLYIIEWRHSNHSSGWKLTPLSNQCTRHACCDRMSPVPHGYILARYILARVYQYFNSIRMPLNIIYLSFNIVDLYLFINIYLSFNIVGFVFIYICINIYIYKCLIFIYFF